MFGCCLDATQILMQSYEQTGLISGISDIIVVSWGNNKFKSTPFLACFGSLTHKVRKQKIDIYINYTLIQNNPFSINRYGYLEPLYPRSSVIADFGLQHGRNVITIRTKSVLLQAQIYMYTLKDKIVISDMDGTMTRTDFKGLLNNYRQRHYLHDGYQTFIRQLSNNGYKIVWVSMRSISLYNFSKNYIRKHIGIEGPLLLQPQQFLPALKKQLMRKTDHVKTNMMKSLRDLYPEHINPLVGGLGNRQNDAIAYLALGIPLQRIYNVTETSTIITMKNIVLTNYLQLHQQIQSHFPKISQKQSLGSSMVQYRQVTELMYKAQQNQRHYKN